MKPIERRRTALQPQNRAQCFPPKLRSARAEHRDAQYLRRRHALCDEFVPTPKHRSATPLQDARGNQPRACNRLGLYRSRGPCEACHFSQRFTECGRAV